MRKFIPERTCARYIYFYVARDDLLSRYIAKSFNFYYKASRYQNISLEMHPPRPSSEFKRENPSFGRDTEIISDRRQVRETRRT